jgi:hypothetical protein
VTSPRFTMTWRATPKPRAFRGNEEHPFWFFMHALHVATKFASADHRQAFESRYCFEERANFGLVAATELIPLPGQVARALSAS